MTTQSTATPEPILQQAQAYEYFARSIKNDLRDYWIGERSNTAFLHEQIERLGCALDSLSSIGQSDFYLLNRAISYYLMHSPANKCEKEAIIRGVESATKAALSLSLYSSEIGYWSWIVDRIVKNLDDTSRLKTR